MRNRVRVLFLAVMIAAGAVMVSRAHAVAVFDSAIVPGELAFHEPDEEIPWAWFSYVPESLDKAELNYILVSGQNGNVVSIPNFYYHEISATYPLAEMAERYAKKYNYISLTPVIPRIAGLYAVAFEREVFMPSTDDFYARPDLKLNSMIDRLLKILRSEGYNVHDKVFIEGFSAGGMFTNAYTFIHPERVQAAAMGSSGWMILPFADYKGFPLNWPLGINDFEELTGRKFNDDAYRTLPKFVYLGDLDTEHSHVCCPERKYWKEEQIDFLKTNFGDTDPVRLGNMCDYLQSLRYYIEFKSYPDTDHSKTSGMENDIFSFFEAHEEGKPSIRLPIKINGMDLPKTPFVEGAPALVTVGVYPGLSAGLDSEWWIVRYDQSAFYSLVEGAGWVSGIAPYTRTPLHRVEEMEIFDSTLPPAEHIFYFGIDREPDGIPNVKSLDLNFIQIDVRKQSEMVEFEYDFTIPVAKTGIEIDGKPGDWTGISPVLTDPEGDGGCGPTADTKSFYLAFWGSDLYWRIDTCGGSFDYFKEAADPQRYISIELVSTKGISDWRSVYTGYRFAFDKGYVSTQEINGSPGMLHYSGPQYVAVGKIAEGKIPLHLFEDQFFDSLHINLSSGTSSLGDL